jgi:hypothetical protein
MPELAGSVARTNIGAAAAVLLLPPALSDDARKNTSGAPAEPLAGGPP